MQRRTIAQVDNLRRSNGAPAPKLAEQIAFAIEDEIFSKQLPAGHALGREADLAKCYGVSRWTMREAIAILEQTDTVTARRGGKGGLFVAAPASAFVRNSLGSYVEFAQRDVDAIIAARLALSRVMIARAIEHLTIDARARLAKHVAAVAGGGAPAVAAMAQARAEIIRIAGNPLLELFMSALSDILLHACWLSGLNDDAFIAIIDRLARANAQGCNAIIAGDAEMAVACEARCLALFRELYLASSVSGLSRSRGDAPERAYALFPAAKPAKKAERLAWAIRQRIADSGWRTGMNLGTEASLMATYGVGRSVLREAIRSLERLGLVAMGRGGASGLTIIAPDPGRIVATVRRYLDRVPPSEEQLSEVRAALRSIPGADGALPTTDDAAVNGVAALFLDILSVPGAQPPG